MPRSIRASSVLAVLLFLNTLGRAEPLDYIQSLARAGMAEAVSRDGGRCRTSSGWVDVSGPCGGASTATGMDGIGVALGALQAVEVGAHAV